MRDALELVMVATAFSCPHCSATLRIQDRALLGRQLNCPDCAGPILIESDGRHGFAAVAAGAAVAQAETPAAEPAAGWKLLATSPAVVGWTVAVGSALGLLAYMNSGGDDEYAVTASGANEIQAGNGETDAASPRLDEADEGETDGVAAAVEEAEREPTDTAATDARREVTESVDEPAAAVQPDESGVAGREADPVSDASTPTSAPAPVVSSSAADPDRADVPPRSASGAFPHSFSTPLEPVVAPKPLDVASALLQPIASYRTTQPVPLQTLLKELQDMAGVPIHADGLAVANKPITVRLQSTSVGDILRVVLEQAGLSYTSNVDGVRLHSAEEPLEGNGP